MSALTCNFCGRQLDGDGRCACKGTQLDDALDECDHLRAEVDKWQRKCCDKAESLFLAEAEAERLRGELGRLKGDSVPLSIDPTTLRERQAVAELEKIINEVREKNGKTV